MWICADCTRAALRGTGATPNSQKLLATTAHEKLLATTSVPVLNGDVTPKVGNDAPIETPASRRAIQPPTDEMGGVTMLKFPSPQAANCARGSSGRAGGDRQHLTRRLDQCHRIGHILVVALAATHRQPPRLGLPRVLGRSTRTTAVKRVCRFYFPLIHIVFLA